MKAPGGDGTWPVTEAGADSTLVLQITLGSISSAYLSRGHSPGISLCFLLPLHQLSSSLKLPTAALTSSLVLSVNTSSRHRVNTLLRQIFLEKFIHLPNDVGVKWECGGTQGPLLHRCRRTGQGLTPSREVWRILAPLYRRLHRGLVKSPLH